MEKGLLKVNWSNLSSYTEEEITYFLFLEGKPVDAICKIRGLDKSEVQKHIIDGKIRYRYLTKSRDAEELFAQVENAGKEDKVSVLRALDETDRKELLAYIRARYSDMQPKEKEAAVWLLGEMKDETALDVLIKASVHKFINIRRLAVSAMGKIGHKDAETALLRALDDDNPQVVLYAVKSLTKIGSHKAANRIREILEASTKPYLKNAAAEYLNARDSSNLSVETQR